MKTRKRAAKLSKSKNDQFRIEGKISLKALLNTEPIVQKEGSFANCPIPARECVVRWPETVRYGDRRLLLQRKGSGMSIH
jgi:hypothetical protein